MQKSILSVAGVLVLGAVLILVNSIGANLFSRFYVDMTGDRLYTLSEGTKNILGNIKNPITVRFYLSKTDSYNYGGWTSGPRWFFWLMPLWLLASLSVLDCLSTSRWGRRVIYVTFAWSAMSVAYVGMNPWSHPWLYRFLEYLGWIRY